VVQDLADSFLEPYKIILAWYVHTHISPVCRNSVTTQNMWFFRRDF